MQPVQAGPAEGTRLKALAEQIMTSRQVQESADIREADCAIGVPGMGRFRTNVFQQRGTLSFVFRAIPYQVKEGGVQYGMQAFDQSLMDWYRKDVISYDDAVCYSSNPSEFALKVSGIDATSDRTFADRLDTRAV